MTNVLILSDSHGLVDDIIKIKQRHQIKHMIHCGDSELEQDNPALADMINVRGNCDIDLNVPNEEIIELADLRFFVTHGHLYDVRGGLMKLSYRASEEKAQVVCFGHTHIAGATKIDNQLFINPGSIRFPRNSRVKTYAIMTWDTLDHIIIQFYTHTGVVIEELTYITSLK